MHKHYKRSQCSTNFYYSMGLETSISSFSISKFWEMILEIHLHIICG